MQYQVSVHARATLVFALLALFLCSPAIAQSNIKLLGKVSPFPGDNRYADVWGEGNYAYLGSYNGSGVMIIDVSDPTKPTLAGYYNPPEGGRFQDVIARDGIGYFSSENRGGVHIVDVRNPATPALLSQINTDKNGFVNVHELAFADGILYEADSRTTVVKAFDVRNPAAPVFIRDIQTTDTQFIHAVIVVNGRLFTSGWSGKTDIYDVRNILTQAPPLLGSVSSGNSSHASWPSNDGKLLASARETTNGDVRLFDISNPASPVLLSAITAQSLGLDAFSAHNPYIVGNMLFVSWYQAGLVVIDITDPRQPKLTGVYDTYPGSVSGFNGCWGVYPFLGFDRVLISDLTGGLYIVDATAALAGPRTVSAASYGFSAIASKSIVAAFGSDLSLSTEAAQVQPLPTMLAGTKITVQDFAGTDRDAPLFFASPTQINYQIPAGSVAGPALVKCTTSTGQVFPNSVIIKAVAPAIFTTDQSGSGPAVALDAFNFTLAPFNATRADGQPNIIVIYGSGLGEDATDIDENFSSSVQALIDGQAAIVSYAGRAPGFVGLNQFNVILPVGISSGAHQMVIKRGGVESNTASISIK